MASEAQTFGSLQTLTLLKIIEDPKTLLFTWVISVNIYTLRN